MYFALDGIFWTISHINKNIYKKKKQLKYEVRARFVKIDSYMI